MAIAQNPFQLEDAERLFQSDWKTAIAWLEAQFQRFRYSGGAFKAEARDRCLNLIRENLICETEIGLAEFGELAFEDWTEAMGAAAQFANLQLDQDDWFDIGGYLSRRLDLTNCFYETWEDEDD